MCGFVGIWHFDGRAVEIDRIEEARDLMLTRGPDQCGLWSSPSGHVALGHRRLAILDLSEGGRQPMVDPRSGRVLVFNGEIYNFRELGGELARLGHRLETRSDSEVILAAYDEWGEDCLRRLVGMFALAIWDPREARLLLARDPLGVKPLFWARTPRAFAFSSRLEPVLRLVGPARLSQPGIAQFLEMGRTCGTATVVEGVQRLLPGHAMTVDAGGCRSWTHWEPDAFPEDPSLLARDDEDLVDRLDELVRESVRLRMVSDVPVGVLLSGGIDSTLVAAAMTRESGQPVSSFTVGFEESDFDESRHARRVADYLGTRHHELPIKPRMLLEEMLATLDAFDEPVADVAAVPLSLLARLAAGEVKVCLSGDGADELFLGYPVHAVLQRLRWLDRIPAFCRRAVGGAASLLPGRRWGLLAGIAPQRDALDRYLFLRSRGAWLTEIGRSGWTAQSFLPEEARRNAHLQPGSLAGRLDLRWYLPDELLIKTDLATMLHSLESREPLLDHRLAAFALALPFPLKRNKYLLRKLLARYVPPEIWDRPKQGFNVPIGRWLRGPLRFLLEELADAWTLDDLLERSILRRAIERHLAGREDLGGTLWTCIALHRWREKMGGWIAGGLCESGPAGPGAARAA